MLGSAILEAAIGTTVIYILLGLVCMAFSEWITRLFKLRPGVLQKDIKRLLGPELSSALTEHPLILGTFDGERYPNYIPTSTFALALMELGYEYTPGTKGDPGVTKVREKWTGDAFVLLDSLRLAATSMGPIQARIEKWFDLAMEETSGKFKRIVSLIILGFSAAIVAGANVNTIAIASHLYDGALTHSATHFVLFWPDREPWYLVFAGLVLTWAAVSLGAPFWFDVLNKLVNLRQAGLPPDENKRQTAGLQA